MMQNQSLILSVNTAAKASTCQWRLWKEITQPEDSSLHLENSYDLASSFDSLPSFRQYIHYLRQIYELSVFEEYQDKFSIRKSVSVSEVLDNSTSGCYNGVVGQDTTMPIKDISAVQSTNLVKTRPHNGDSFYLVSTQRQFGSYQIKDEIPFLIASENGYRIQICRYSAHVRKETKIQLAGMVWLAKTAGIRLAKTAEVLLASGRIAHIATKDLDILWEENLIQLQKLFEKWQSAREFGWWDCRHICGNCEDCEEAIASHDDLLKITGLGPRLRERLHREGIRTCRELALKGSELVSPRILTLARLQVASKDQRQLGTVEKNLPPRVRFNALAPSLQNLPDANRGDLYLDFENDPLWKWTADDHTGLLYLAGLIQKITTDSESKRTQHFRLKNLGRSKTIPIDLELEKPGELSAALGYRYLSFWAHSRKKEKAMLVALVKFLQEHFQRYPSAHIYHYSEQEKLFLRRLSKRHKMLNEQVEEICSRCIDLLPMVQQAVLSGNGGYSLKHLEAVYMGELHRQGKYQQGADSVVAYDIWNRGWNADDQIEPAETVQTLVEIAAYNEYDCCSTLVLHQWLVEQYNLQAVENRCLYRGNRPYYKKGPAEFSR